MSSDIATLILDLTSEAPSRRLEAAQRLATLGEEAAPAAVALIQACVLEDETSDWASSTLESLGAPDPSTLPELIQLLADPRSDVGYWAATLIGRLGSSASSARESLQACETATPHEVVRKRAQWALERIGSSG